MSYSFIILFFQCKELLGTSAHAFSSSTSECQWGMGCWPAFALNVFVLLVSDCEFVNKYSAHRLLEKRPQTFPSLLNPQCSLVWVFIFHLRPFPHTNLLPAHWCRLNGYILENKNPQTVFVFLCIFSPYFLWAHEWLPPCCNLTCWFWPVCYVVSDHCCWYLKRTFFSPPFYSHLCKYPICCCSVWVCLLFSLTVLLLQLFDKNPSMEDGWHLQT